MACRICKSKLIAKSTAASGSYRLVGSRGDGRPTFYSEGKIYCPSCGILYLFDPDGDDLIVQYSYEQPISDFITDEIYEKIKKDSKTL